MYLILRSCSLERESCCSELVFWTPECREGPRAMWCINRTETSTQQKSNNLLVCILSLQMALVPVWRWAEFTFHSAAGTPQHTALFLAPKVHFAKLYQQRLWFGFFLPGIYYYTHFPIPTHPQAGPTLRERKPLMSGDAFHIISLKVSFLRWRPLLQEKSLYS